MHKTYKCDNTQRCKIVEVSRVAITQLVKQCSKQYNFFKSQRCKIVEVSRVAIPCWAVAKPEAPPGDTLIGPRCGEHCARCGTRCDELR